jgi:uncharacterized repeat protein (TIGR01451 family)
MGGKTEARMHPSRRFGNQRMCVLFFGWAWLFLLKLTIVSTSANLLWTPINGPANPQLTVPGRVVLTWQFQGPNLVQNGSFDQSPTNGWRIETSERMTWRWVNTPPTAITPNRSLGFNVGNSSVIQFGSISQVVTIPWEAESAILSWKELAGGFFNPVALRLEVRTLENEVMLSQPARADSSTVRVVSADLSRFAGQTIKIVFLVQGQSGASITLDDIRLAISPVADAEFDVYFGPTATLNSSHLLGQTTQLRWDVTDRVVQRAMNYWRVDVRSRGQLAKGPVWSFTQSIQVLSPSELLLRNPIQAAAINEPVALGAIVVGENGAPWTQKPASAALLDAGLAAAGIRPASICITELQFGSTNAVEFMNVTTNEIDISDWKIVVHVSEAVSGVFTNTLPSGTKVPAGEIFLLLPGSPAPGSYPLLRTGRSSAQGAPQAVALFDAEGELVDFVHLLPRSTIASVRPTELWVLAAQSVENWIGAAAFAPESNRSLLRIGSSDRNDRLDWTIGTNSLGSVNTNLVYPFSPGVGILSGSHVTLSNTNATAWIGSLSSIEPATNAFLVARYQTFHARQGMYTITGLPIAEILLPVEVAEDSTEPLTGTVRLKNVMTNDVRATFLADPEGRLDLPAEVVIPAGSLEATFQYSAVDNSDLSGPVRVRISLQSEQIEGAASLLLLDDEKPVLTLLAPSELAENSSAPASVQLDAPLAFDLQVQLRSDYEPVLVHPYSVTIPAGETAVLFTLDSPEDPYFSDSKQVTLRAAVHGWPAAERSIVITDNEPKKLTVATTSSQYPETFYQLEALFISLGGIAATDIPLTIHSSDRTELAPVTNAVIRAGSSQVALAFQMTGDDLKDGTQPVTLTVSSPGFEPVSIALEIMDDDPASFEVGVSSGTKFQGVPFTVGLRGLDINGVYINSFGGTAALSASNTAGQVTLTPTSTGPFASWGATVQARIDQPGEKFWIAAETNGAVGVSAPFRLLPSPLFKTLSLAMGDMRITGDRSNLVATATESDPDYPNRILIIGAATTEISRTIPVRRLAGGDQPGSFGVDGQLALSPDGSSIFVIAENGTMVQQFAWDNGALVGEFSLGTNEFGGAKIASRIEGVPGKANQVAVAQVDGWNALTTRIYDGGILLPGIAPFATKMMLRAAPERSYLSASGSLWAVSLGAAGFEEAQLLPRPGDVPFWEGGDAQLREEKIHFTTGAVYDPATGQYATPYPLHRVHYPRDLIGTFDFDTQRGRAFFITPRGIDSNDFYNGGQVLDLFDTTTHQAIRRIELGMIPGYVTRLFYLGDALAAMNATGIYFLRSSMFEPVGTPVAVAISRQATNTVASVGVDFTYTISITNQGTNPATELTVEETIPTGVALVSAEPTIGRWENTSGGLRWIVDDLAAGAGADLRITIKASHGGIFNFDSSVASYEWNTSANQRLRTEVNVQLGLSQNAYAHFPLGARSIAFDKTRRLVYASISPGPGTFSEKILEINPDSGRIVGSFEAGPRPSLLAVSEQDQFLWVVSDDRRNVRRYSLPEKIKDLEFQLRTHPPTPTFSSPIYDTVIAIEPVPGRPHSLAILQLRIYEGTGTGGGGIAIYDDNVLRPHVGLETEGSYVVSNQILFHPTEPTIYGSAAFNQSLEIFDLTAQGVTVRQRFQPFPTFGHPGLALRGTDLVAGDGSVLNTSDLTTSGYITNMTGQNLISTGAGTVTLHPGNRLSFVQSSKTSFADLSTRAELGSIDLSLGQDYPVETIATADQLIFLLSGGGIYFVRSEHLALTPLTPPSLKPILASGALTIAVESQVGLKYQLQSAPTLPGEWSDVGDPKSGNGSELEFPAGASNGSQSFYRLKIE